MNQQANEQAIKRRIRVKKEDSAFVYAILEASEGIAAYSTLDHQAGDAYRDLELQIPVGFLAQVEELLARLNQDGCHLFPLDPEEPSHPSSGKIK